MTRTSLERPEQIIDRCNTINRTRPLTEAEVDELERAIRHQQATEYRQSRTGMIKPMWTAAEDETLRTAMRDGVSCANAGKLLGRTENAIRGRLRVMPNPPVRKYPR